MSGYKRVNFYELCRLCASNQQNKKTHIFQEEGRKMQLLNKIQSCLSLTVYEHDFLPKVVCSKCLNILELCHTFKQECTSSEMMLSGYFKNFRCTEDFKKSGKVYIKDETKEVELTEPVKSEYRQVEKPQEPMPYYQVDQPVNRPEVAQNSQFEAKCEFKMVVQNQAYQTPAATKPKPEPQQQQISNVVVNANGEVINIGQIVDLETFIGACPQPKPRYKRSKPEPEEYPDSKKLVFATDYAFQSYTPYEQPSTVNLNAIAQPIEVCYPPKTKPQKRETGDKSHVCDICNKSFKRREHVYQHIKLHTGFRPYTCENCNKSFMRKEHLLRHMTSHSGLKNFQCPVCEKSFSRNDNLLKHRKTHEKQQSYTCEVCQKHFVMKHYYLAHKTSHEMAVLKA